MSKKTKKENKPKEVKFPEHEDFFTVFIDKRKGYFVKKVEEIGILQKADPSTLKTDQIEKIRKLPDTLEKIKYFDDIKLLYFEAYSRRKPVANQVSPCPNETRVAIAGDIANLLAIGQAIRNFEQNSQTIEHMLNSDQMITIQDVYASLTTDRCLLATEEAKVKLTAYTENEPLKAVVAEFLANKGTQSFAPVPETIVEKQSETLVQPESKTQAQNLGIFADDSEDEEDPKFESGKDAEEVAPNQEEIEAAPMSFLKPLPEGEEKKNDEFRSNRPKKQRKPDRENGERRPPRRREGENNEENKRKGEEQGGDEKKPRRFNNRRPPRSGNGNEKGNDYQERRDNTEGRPYKRDRRPRESKGDYELKEGKHQTN